MVIDLLSFFNMFLRSLADVDHDRFLSCDEFVLAMYILQCKLEGQDIPDELPDSLLPPPPVAASVSEDAEINQHDISSIKIGKALDSRPSFKVVITDFHHISDTLVCFR